MHRGFSHPKLPSAACTMTSKTGSERAHFGLELERRTPPPRQSWTADAAASPGTATERQRPPDRRQDARKFLERAPIGEAILVRRLDLRRRFTGRTEVRREASLAACEGHEVDMSIIGPQTGDRATALPDRLCRQHLRSARHSGRHKLGRPSTVPRPRLLDAGRRPAQPRPRESDAGCVPSRFDALAWLMPPADKAHRSAIAPAWARGHETRSQPARPMEQVVMHAKEGPPGTGARTSPSGWFR